MNKSLQVFNNGIFSIRTINDNGIVWFVAKDIAEALEYNLDGGMSRIFGHVPECWTGGKRIAVRSENGVEQEREMLCLTEQGVYFFLGRSDKPKAIPYQMWIAGDVVPSIRQTGSYSINKESKALTGGITDSARIIFEAAGIRGNQLALALDKLHKSYTGHSALQAAGIELIAPEKEQTLTPTEIAETIGIGKGRTGAQVVNKLLETAGYQRRIAKNWEPLGVGKNFAIVMDTNKKHSDGTPVRQVKWTSGIVNIIQELIA